MAEPLSEKTISQANEPEPELCVICQTELGQRNVVTTSCNHKFHWSCLHPWQKKQNTCPFCRVLLLTVEDEPPEAKTDSEVAADDDHDTDDDASDTQAILRAHQQDLALLERLAQERYLRELQAQTEARRLRVLTRRLERLQLELVSARSSQEEAQPPATQKQKKKKKKPTREYDPDSPPTRKGYVLSPRKKKKSPSSLCKSRAKKRGSKKGSRKAYEY